jgi:hypothetical protein
MNKITKQLCVAGVAAFAFSVNAQAITYVDAVDGASGNTYATGGALATTTWYETGTLANDNAKWRKRTLGNNSTVYEGDYNAQSDPELTTQVTGLSDGNYNVWAFFWDSSGTGNTWTMSAGLTSGSLSPYSNDGPGSQVVTAMTLADFTSIGMVTEGDRTLYGINLGQATVAGGSGLINVFVDGTSYNGVATPNASATRTWYDGVGYEAVPEPSIAALFGLTGLMLLLRRRR